MSKQEKEIFIVGDLLIPIKDIQSDVRGDTLVKITDTHHVLQDNYCGQLFEVENDKVYELYVALPKHSLDFTKEKKLLDYWPAIIPIMAITFVICMIFQD